MVAFGAATTHSSAADARGVQHVAGGSSPSKAPGQQKCSKAAQHSGFTFGTNAAAAGAGSTAFTELDANTNPYQRKDARSMGDQARQQANAAGAGAEEAPAAPSAAWASFMSSFQQQAYVSPGARATGRRAGAHKGATPRASRMQPSSAAAAAGAGAAWPGPAAASAAGAAAPPMFAFGSPMQQAGSAGTAPAQAAGNTPVPSTLPPGTAMSTDTAMPADFTAAFSAMSVDAATPAVGSGSSSQPWAFRGPRAAAVTGKRLFDTPSTAGADSSTPSPFGSWGRGNAAGEGGSAQQACGGSNRAGAGPVPFTGFGSTVNQDTAAAAAATGSASPASGSFSFNQGVGGSAGKHSPGHGRSRARQQQRSSPAAKPPPAPSFSGFGGFSSTAFGQPAGSSSSPAAVPSGAAGNSSSSSTPAAASGNSFHGFFTGKGPGSAASTPGFSPMMWSPVDNAAQPTEATAEGTSAAAAPAAFSFEAVGSRQASAAASEQQAQARLGQAQCVVSQQQASGDADVQAAAAVPLPAEDDDRVEAVAEVLTDLSTSATCVQQQQAAEPEAVAGLRAAVQQLSTAEQQQAPQPAQQQRTQQQQPSAATQPPLDTQQQQQQQQQQPAVPAFVFGSPDHAAAGGMARSGSAWLTSPEGGATGAVPTTLFDMSPLKTTLPDLSSSAGPAAAAATAAAGAHRISQGATAPAGRPAAATSAASQALFGAGPSTASTAATAAARGSSAGPESAPPADSGATAFAFTPGKGSKAAQGGSGRAAARSKKHTPSKAQQAVAATDTGTAAESGAASFGFVPAAFGAAGHQAGAAFAHKWRHSSRDPRMDSSNPFAAHEQQQQQAAAGASADTPMRRRVHAVQQRAKLAGVQRQQPPQQPSNACAWPPAGMPPPGEAATAAPPNISFTVGVSKATGGSTPARSPRKGHMHSQPFKQQQQQQQQPPQHAGSQMDSALQQALSVAQQHFLRAKHCWDNGRQSEAAIECTKGIQAVQPFSGSGHQAAADIHAQLLHARSAARIGQCEPLQALQDAADAVRLKRKYIEAWLRTATCLMKLGCLVAADQVLDKVLDMIPAGHQQWSTLNTKRRQVQELVHKQRRVVAAALGCDEAAAAAALAPLSSGEPVQELLSGLISVSAQPAAAAAAALAEAGTAALEDASAAQQLLADAGLLTKELAFWDDAALLQAWLMLRAGQLGAAATAADAVPNDYFGRQPHHSSRQWGWRWWVQAQIKWHEGDLAAAKPLLQAGQEQLRRIEQLAGSSSSSAAFLWHVLMPSQQELQEALQQVQELVSLKEAGNTAIQAKQYEKASEEYSKALALQPSWGFAAVIHSNRAAALQQQQRLVEALADCSRAVALDPKYARAYLRLAQILDSLHRADRAVVVLQDALKGSANAVDPATTRGHELTHGAAFLQLSHADRRKFEDMLASAQVAARRFKTPHHYKALGVSMTASEADIRKAYRGLALKHHPDKALQHCRWSVKLGAKGAAPAHLSAASGGIEGSLKAAANEVFGFLSAAQEELTNSTSRSKLDRDLRTEEQLWSNSSSSSSYGAGNSRPASYTYSYGGRRAESDYDFEGIFTRTGSSSTYGGRTWQQQASGQGAAASGSSRGSRASGSGGGGAGGGAGSSRQGAGGGASSKWYQQQYWEEGNESSEEDEDDSYGYGGAYHYRSRY